MSRGAAPRPASARGFSLIELLTVLVLISILAGIALPSFRVAVARADAARVVSDVTTIRMAAFEYLSDYGVLPDASTWGELPTGLETYLPEGFDFSYKGVEYAWSLLGAGAPLAMGSVEIRNWAYTVAMPATEPAAQGQGQAKGQGQGQGKGQSGSTGSTGGGSSTGSTGGSAGEATGGSTTLSLDGAVGVLWVRYAADDPIAFALQSVSGVSAFWTPTQMMFVLGG